MIDKVLKLPNYINVIKLRKYSKYMELYLEENIIDSLRTLYVQDIKTFNNVLRELQIRGIGFKEEYQNNFLKGINYSINEIIVVEENKQRFQQIDFSFFGLGNFISNYYVTDDRFFNNIPINGLYQYIPSFKRELFKQTLINLNFHISSNPKIKNSKLEKPTIDTSYNVRNDVRCKRIYDYFDRYEYPHFRNFCAEYSLDTLDDLNDDVMASYKEYRSTHEKTYLKVLKKYESILNIIKPNSSSQTIFNNNFKDKLEENEEDYLKFLNEYFSESNLLKAKPYEEYLSRYEQIFYGEINQGKKLNNDNTEPLISLKKHNTYSNIKDIPINRFLNHFEEYNIFDQELQKISELSSSKVDESIIKKILKIINANISISEYWDEFKAKLRPNERKVLELRTQKLTLQDIGQILEVSRERIRQIEIGVTKKFSNGINYRFLNDLIKIYLDKFIIIDSEFFVNKEISVEDIEELKFLILKDKNYISINDGEYILNLEKYNYYEEIVQKISEGETIISKGILLEFSSSESIIIEWFLQRNGFKVINNKFVRNKLPIVEMLEYLFKEKIKGPVKNDKESYEVFKGLFKSYFDYDLNSNQRSFFTRVANTNNVILVDKNTYMYDDLNQTDSHFINEIKKAIDKHLEISSYADPRRIYSQHPTLMRKNNIISHQHLYSIIKHYYSDVYNIGLKNTLYIYHVDKKKKSSESLFNISLGDEVVVSYKELQNKMNWTDYKLDQLISRLDYIVLNSSRQIIDITGIEEENYYDELINTIQTELEKGYIFTVDLNTKLYSSKHLYALLSKYHLAEISALSHFVKKKIEGIRGSWQFLHNKDEKIHGVESVLPEIFNEIVEKSEIKKFLLDKGYASSSYYIMLDRIQGLELFIPFDRDSYRNMKKMPLSEMEITQIDKMLRNSLYEKELLTYQDLVRIVDLPELVDLDLTTYAITYIAEELGYKLIEAYDGSQYELPIILSSNSDVKDYDDLVYRIVVTSYNNIFSTNKLMKFLKEKNIMSKNAKGIYLKLKKSKLFDFDDFDTFDIIKEG